MPVVDAEQVCETKAELGAVSTQARADALGAAFGQSFGGSLVE